MRECELQYVLGTAFYRLAWTEWGDPHADPVLCVHGLTRNGRDFDVLAAALADRFRVVCPDLPGRGRSQWLPDPALYTPVTYVQALSHLLAVIGQKAAWVGTSLGGICGMAIAAARDAPVSKLLLNDVGPFIPKSALERIAAYLGAAPASVADVQELESLLRSVHAPFGALTDAQWAAMARHSARALPDGRVALHYDPKIATAMLATPPADQVLWPIWGAIRIPRLVIRGADSDLLDRPTVARMAAEGATTHEVPGAGHAPALMDAPTIAVVRAFLEA